MIEGTDSRIHTGYGLPLRVVGACLDRIGALQVTVAELEDGFFWQGILKTGIAEVGMVMRHELEQLGNELKHGRQGRELPGARSLSLTANAPMGRPARQASYQELLRSLAIRLDAAQAMSVLVSEIDDRMVVEYHVPVRGGTTAALVRASYLDTQLAQLVARARAMRAYLRPEDTLGGSQ